jgi:cell division protein FtsW (lipid II flippase)
MQLSTDVGALRPRHQGLAGSLPAWVELALVLAAIAAMLPAFDRVAELADGREHRFADTGLRVTELPQPTLPAVCTDYARQAEAMVRERLCTAFSAAPSAAATSSGTRLPAVLEQATLRVGNALLAPLNEAEVRLNGLRLQQRLGGGDVRDIASGIAAIEADIQPYIDRFQLTPRDSAGPPALGCAVRWLEAALAAPAKPGNAGAAQAMAQANALLLLAAAVDGRSATAPLANAALLPGPAAPGLECEGGATAALSATAAVLGDARQSLINARKDEAMRRLLPAAGVQWAGAMLLGFALLVWSRRCGRPALGVAAALALWALAAWLARVSWPFAGHRAFEPARPERWEQALASPPADFVWWLLASAALVWVWAISRKRDNIVVAPAQAMSTRVGYPGLVLATGMGALLLLDLSANGYPVNRYLALYHQGHLWLGMLLFSVLLFLRQPLARGLGWLLSIIGEAASSTARRLSRSGAFVAVVLVTSAALMVFALSLSNLRQLTSELGRVWLIVGAAWFFFLRAGPLAERLARAGPAAVAVWRYLWPLLFVVAVLIAAMLVTHDMGPLLIAGYASGAFLAASVAMWWHLRSGRTLGPFVLAVVLFAAWIAVVTLALFQLGSVDGVTATRLESLAAPFASTNDQQALVSWFQRAAPAQGFGIGSTPWCGFAPTGQCSGVPAQIHSDYTFTAIVGVFGSTAAWAAAVGCALWLNRLVRHHGRVTRGEPRLVASAGHLAFDGQALLSWICVAWVVLTSCQLAVTVAGNLAVLPLTGVTFPFVSFGMTSLLVNLAFLALCLNVNLPARDSTRGSDA